MAFVTFYEFAVTFGFVLLSAICAVGHFGWHHLTARQHQREIVTRKTEISDTSSQLFTPTHGLNQFIWVCGFDGLELIGIQFLERHVHGGLF